VRRDSHAPLAGAATPALGGLFAAARPAGKTVLFMSSTSKIKNENPDDFATYLAKRQAAAEGRVWTPDAPAAPAPAPVAAAPVAAAPAADSGTSKIKNENPDDFATYMAKRKAAAEGRVWTPGDTGSGTTTLDAYMPTSSPVPAQSGPRSGDGKWVAPDSYATRTLSRDAPFPASQSAGMPAPATGGTHDAQGRFKHYGYGGYTPKR